MWKSEFLIHSFKKKYEKINGNMRDYRGWIVFLRGRGLCIEKACHPDELLWKYDSRVSSFCWPLCCLKAKFYSQKRKKEKRKSDFLADNNETMNIVFWHFSFYYSYFFAYKVRKGKTNAEIRPIFLWFQIHNDLDIWISLKLLMFFKFFMYILIIIKFGNCF